MNPWIGDELVGTAGVLHNCIALPYTWNPDCVMI